jgi:hypothetical protein
MPLPLVRESRDSSVDAIVEFDKALGTDRVYPKRDAIIGDGHAFVSQQRLI